MRTLLCLLLCFLQLQGVLRRNDLLDEAYLDFGKDSRFEPVGLIRGMLGSSTGTLIDRYTVLTAAHVVKRSGDRVLFELFDPVNERTISIGGSVEQHPDFLYIKGENNQAEKIYHDIALIHLSSPVDFVAPASLDYRKRQGPFLMVSAGFGTCNGGVLDLKKRGYTNQISGVFSQSWCSPSFISYFNSPPACTCLEGAGAQGDSGSGIFIVQNEELFLCGILYLLAGDGTYSSFNLILPIEPYQDWLENNRYHG